MPAHHPTHSAASSRVLMDKEDATDGDDVDRTKALEKLNAALTREGFEAFYGEDRQCYLRHIGTNTVVQQSPNPHRHFSVLKQKKRAQLAAYLGKISENELIGDVLLPLFRQRGFHRVTVAGHKDTALEYGKDLWMKYTLPTTHVLYFGIQAKKDKIDSSGVSTANVAEIYNQVSMMLGHEIFDPEIGKRVLVDHAYIVAGGEITKQARNWLGNKLDAQPAQSDHLHGSRRHFESVRCHQHAAACEGSSAPAARRPRRRDTLLTHLRSLLWTAPTCHIADSDSAGWPPRISA